jgi:hypothetical protein
VRMSSLVLQRWFCCRVGGRLTRSRSRQVKQGKENSGGGTLDGVELAGVAGLQGLDRAPSQAGNGTGWGTCGLCSVNVPATRYLGTCLPT